MSICKPHVILNPASSGGRVGSQEIDYRLALTRHFGADFSLFVTRKPLDATLSARAAIRDGHELIIAIGGDGTIQEVVNGFFLNGELINPAAQLGVINGGTTGRGFARNIGMLLSLDEQLEAIRFGCTHHLDIARIEVCAGVAGNLRRFFVNVSQLGIGAEVVRLVQQKHKRLGGFFRFGVGAVQAILSHRGQAMTVRIDEVTIEHRSLIGIIVANGAYAAGGMNLAPGARLDDGRLNVLCIANLWIPGRLRALSRIRAGGHIESRAVSYTTATSIAVDSEERVFVSADGELLGTTPCRIEVQPSLLPVRVPTDWDAIRRGDDSEG